MAEAEDLDRQGLLESTQLYLKSIMAGLVADTITPPVNLDVATPFGELGLDSFRILRVVKQLEADFGVLPKTLLFEYFNIEALAGYFVDRHRDAAYAKCGVRFGASFAVNPAANEMPHTVEQVQSMSSASQPVHPADAAAPILMLEKDLPAFPRLQVQIDALFSAYRNEGSVSRGTRSIAPNLFIDSARRGCFHYGRCKNLVMAYAYTGSASYFAEAAAEFNRYCEARQYQLNLLTDEVIEEIGGVRFSSTPFGVVQRLRELAAFSLEGGAMRRLRYQVSKFEKAGACRTIEYRCGCAPEVDRDIARVIDRWCETKPMVNPLIGLVREEVLAGRLEPQHRLFLTYLDNVLQNVILISAMSAQAPKGYLMDLEFYPPDMPLGGLEYAIVNMIGTLAGEGCDLLSLGGTYGCRLTSCANADQDVERALDDLHKQNIFNDQGNLQFKNKFRPENRTLYLCRPAGSGHADNVIDLILMIADPARSQTPDDENHTLRAGQALANAVDIELAAPVPVAGPRSGAESAHAAAPAQQTWLERDARSLALGGHGYNPLNLTAAQIDFDLKTDSWAQLDTAFVQRGMSRLHAQLQAPVNLEAVLRDAFGFEHYVLTEAGRTAEALVCGEWPKRGSVPQNLLFPSGLFEQIDAGLVPHELPHHDAWCVDADNPYKANLDWNALAHYVSAHADGIACVWVELCNNASGGHAVSLEHLCAIRALLAPHGIKLVIDGTRVLDNAYYLITHDAAHAGRNLWAMAHDLLACADVMTGSLAKNFGVDRGGVIATNDRALFDALSARQQRDGGGLDAIGRKLAGLALMERERTGEQVARRVQAAQLVWQALHTQGVPLVAPAGGHCVLIDVKRIADFADLAFPVASFLAWLYLNTGIRGGAHSSGMRKDGPLGGMVRLAIPVGLKPDEVDELIVRLTRAFDTRCNIPELELAEGMQTLIGNPHAAYRLTGYRRASGAPHSGDDHTAIGWITGFGTGPGIRPAAADTPPDAVAESAPMRAAGHAGRRAIAIVGMAGRYPKAASLAEFWDNLRTGRDCVSEISPERLALRSRTAFSSAYRGGFIDGVNRFDSLFFNISPREAELLDPQERLFLEVAWEALEDAGYYPEILGGDGGARRDVGVFVGAVWTMYQIAGVEAKLAGNEVHPNSFLWSIANRVSYWMNLHGPSLTVDTACSSSLTALHLACEAIQSGDCSSALVGGVNLDLHQHKFDVNRAGGAISDDGVCRAFGAGADGYVAGEGIGALLIKPLDEALRDRDHVYGVIKGVMVNHGGRTAGYTVPNPQAQGGLIAATLQRAGVTPETIGYVEAHGTGTELGDPIEIAGLSHAYSGAPVPAQSCPIGSVKTNIGHLEAAAGLAGVTKVLLQMRHGELVPSLHSAQRNPHIDFAATPFHIQQTLAPWRARHAGIPLRAGVSSFGAGGANAHVVLEQHVPDAAADAREPGELAFPLSARNDEQLHEMAARLGLHLRREGAALCLPDVAYTLCNGRKSFDHRLVVFAQDTVQLADRLAAFAAGKSAEHTLTGHAKGADGVMKLMSRAEADEFVALMSRSGDPRKLAQLWLNGLLADWRGISRHGRRTSLPTYPFADRRYWISGPAGKPTPETTAPHPLIDSNESTFERQLFRKTFHAHEFFLRDHVVAGLPTLPGTAYLELAREAASLAAGRPVRKICNVTWVSPLTVAEKGATAACVELKPNGGRASFEVFDAAAGERRIYAQGKLLYGAASGDARHTGNGPAEYLDLVAARERCVPLDDAALASIYARFEQAGMHYGASFKALREVRKGDGEVLGRLELPLLDELHPDRFVLHPVLLDAAMQAGIAAELDGDAGAMKVPYSLSEVEILHPLTRVCYSHVRTHASERGGPGKLSRDDVTIVDETGKVLVRIRDIVGVPLAGLHKPPVAPAESRDAIEMLYYTHAWQPVSLEALPVGGALVLFDVDAQLRDACVRQGGTAALVLRGSRFEVRGGGTYTIDPSNPDDYASVFAALKVDRWPLERICHAWAGATDESAVALAQALECGVYDFLSLCQAFVSTRPAAGAQLLYLYSSAPGNPQPHHEAINGFARTLELEHPRLACKVLELRSAKPDVDATARALLAEFDAGAQAARTIRYDGTGRSIRRLAKLPASELQGGSAPALRHGGVYLITGGAGGLGLLFADHLARRYRANLVLSGRSVVSPQLETKLDALRAHGAQVLYVQADIAHADGVQCVVEACRARFGRIDGILHGAGVLRDALLRNKTRAEMAAVFAPKIFGAHHLDTMTRDDALDFFVLFSSLAALGGNLGQCDYAYANDYLDAFAARRDAQRAVGVRHGRSLSFNWSLWADGGMKLDAQTEQLFRRNLGIEPLSSEAGLAAFEAGLSALPSQLAVLSGVQAKIEQAWGLTQPPAAAAGQAHASQAGMRSGEPRSAGTDGLVGVVVAQLTRTVADLLKLAAEDLSPDSILLELGFDSIGLAAFANAINALYKLDINPVLFFEYSSINAIADVLTREHGAAVHTAFAQPQVSAQAQPKTYAEVHAQAAAPSGPVSAPLSNGIDKGWRTPDTNVGRAPSGTRFSDEPIAIVGIAGIMPQSDDVHEYWRNLRDARDLVTEIPRERWIWEDVHGAPVKDANKSYSRWGGFMKEVDKFDPLFFGITPREAEMMDPQQRLFIQTVRSAIEDAGHRVSDLAGTRTGLFVGVSSQDYIDVLAQHRSVLDGYSASGNAHSILANRISFLFNLRGPSAPLDTACSSSLVALHRAIESIHTGSSDMAIVGGVQVMLTPAGHISLSAAGMLSPDGKCKTFTQGADGYVRGEGVGAIFIKKLSQAQADGNPIYAVIRATAENHGGRATNLTAPNPKAQTELLLDAYEQARIDPSTVGYIECHGTGTSLGDPIEIQALKKSFAELYAQYGKAAPGAPHCGLGSVKTNIGHLEPAAGIASLLKVLLAIRHRQLPAMLHFDTLNPYIDLDGSPFYIVGRTMPWDPPRGEDGAPLPRRAGVSAFGWGGANAHVVLEEYIAADPPAPAATEQIVVLSARNNDRLRAYAGALTAHLRANDADLGDLAYTLQVGRDEMEERLALVASSRDQLLARLEAYLADEPEIAGAWHARIETRHAPQDDTAVLATDPGMPLDTLALAWVSGQRIDWSGLHPLPRRRLSVPTYPFARERYWVGDAALPDAETGSVLAEPVWADATRVARFEAAPQSSPSHRSGSPATHEVVLCELPHLDPARLRAHLPELAHVAQPRAPADADLAIRYQLAALASFERLRQLSEARQEGPALIQIVAVHGHGHPPFDGLAGLVRSARLEQPNLVAQLVLVNDDPDEAALAERLRYCRAASAEAVLRFNGSQASLARWREVSEQPMVPLAWRERGVYLITGGLGALGVTFASEILRQVPRAQVVLTGRAALSEERQAVLTNLATTLAVSPGQLDYRQLDLEQLEQVRELVAAVVARYGTLHGVLHSAGTRRDSLIVNKDTEAFEQVLAPKVTGTFHLDMATRDVDLDFVVLFSSVSAALGNPGQADYAAANGFMDGYAHLRNALVQTGERRGRTLSVNWPLWEDGGMPLDAKSRVRLFTSTGLLPMRTSTGLRTCQQGLAGRSGQLLVMEGQTQRLRRLLFDSVGRHDTARAPRGAMRSLATGRTSEGHAQLFAVQLRQRVLADLHAFQSGRV